MVRGVQLRLGSKLAAAFPGRSRGQSATELAAHGVYDLRPPDHAPTPDRTAYERQRVGRAVDQPEPGQPRSALFVLAVGLVMVHTLTDVDGVPVILDCGGADQRYEPQPRPAHRGLFPTVANRARTDLPPPSRGRHHKPSARSRTIRNPRPLVAHSASGSSRSGMGSLVQGSTGGRGSPSDTSSTSHVGHSLRATLTC